MTKKIRSSLVIFLFSILALQVQCQCKNNCTSLEILQAVRAGMKDGYLDIIKEAIEEVFDKLKTNSPLFQKCPQGWVRIFEDSTSCFWVSGKDQFMNFTNAAEHCHRLTPGARIFEPINIMQNNLVVDWVGEIVTSSGYWWIGVNDQNFEGNFVYSSTGEPNNFHNWRDGEPTQTRLGNRPGRHCVVFDNSRHWSDTECKETHRFVCEKLMEIMP